MDDYAVLANFKDFDIKYRGDNYYLNGLREKSLHKYTNAGMIYIVRDENGNRNDDKFLLLKLSYSSLQWSSPGGKIDPGEEAWEAGKRELKEETGIVLSVEDLLSVQVGIFPPTNTKLFILTFESLPNVKLSSEHTEYKFVKRSDLKSVDFTWYMKGAVENLRLNV